MMRRNPDFRVPNRVFPAILLAAMAVSGWACGAATQAVRKPALAGSWYPADAALVTADVHRLLRAVSSAPVPAGRPVALVVPHAGWRYSGAAAAAAFRILRPGEFDRVVIVGPSHQLPFEGFSVPPVRAYRTPLGEIPLDMAALDEISDGKLVRKVPGAHTREHSIEIELPLLQLTLETFRLVPILAGSADAAMQRDLASRLARLNDGRTLFVFSSDFTHYGPRYGYVPFGPSAAKARDRIAAMDDRAVDLLVHKDAAGFRKFLGETSDTICGRFGLGVLLELLPRIAPKAHPVVLARYRSLDLGENDNSVSYVAMAYVPGKVPEGKPLTAPPKYAVCPPDAPLLDPEVGGALLKIARAALRTELLGTDDLHRVLKSLPISRREFDRVQAAFVTLNRTDPHEVATLGRLRGCIGQVLPTYPLAEAVVLAAVEAALHDRRFRPVRAEELDRLEVEVTALWPPHPVSSWKEIKLGRDGIVLEKGGRRALYLPQVPGEVGWTLEETLDHLARKAGLPAGGWREGASFQVFQGQAFSEHGESSGKGKEGGAVSVEGKGKKKGGTR